MASARPGARPSEEGSSQAAASRARGLRAVPRRSGGEPGEAPRGPPGAGQMSAPLAVSPHDGSGPDLRDGFSPALVMEVELTEPLPAVSYDGRHDRAWVLARLHGEPVGSCVIRQDAAGVAPGQLAALLWLDLREPVADRFAAAGLPAPGTLASRGLAADPADWPFLCRRRDVLAAAPFISIVVCTRDRADRLE